MISNPQFDALKRNRAWVAIGGAALVLWTGLLYYLWLKWHPLGLHCVPAFFLGLLLLVLLGGLGTMILMALEG